MINTRPSRSSRPAGTRSAPRRFGGALNSAEPVMQGGAPDAAALHVAELELAGSPTSLAMPRAYRRARVLVRLHGMPLGFLEVSAEDRIVDVDLIRERARSQFGDAIAEHLKADGLPVDSDRFDLDRTCGAVGTRPWTIVICTRNRPDELKRCLKSVVAIDHPNFEVVVVDNAPTDDATRRVVQSLAETQPHFRYVLEPRPGLSTARNAGVAAATHDLIAFTDDDVMVDSRWLGALEHVFAAEPDVTAVTGIVPAAHLDTTAERFFDARVHWSSSFRARLFSAASPDAGALFPYTVGQIGTGANFAFRRQALRDIGSFDEALGAGTPTQGGEDLDIFLRVLLAGGTIAYTPAAIVWHVHRAGEQALRNQLYAYGLGVGAFATKYLTHPATRNDVLRRVPRALLHMVSLWGRPAASGVEQPRLGVRLAEATGLLAGPRIYLRTRSRK